MDDFLAGPEHIFSILESALPEVHRLRREYPDAVILPSATQLPPPSGMVGPVGEPKTPPGKAIRLVRGVLHNFTKADPAHHERPQLNVPTQDSRWFLLCTVDGVTVTTADSRGVVYRQRDRAKMLALVAGVASAPAQAACVASTTCARRTATRSRRCPVSSSGRPSSWKHPQMAERPARRGRRVGGRAVGARRPARRARGLRAPSRTSASTASAGWPSPRSARCSQPGEATGVAGRRVRGVRRARRRRRHQTSGATGTPASSEHRRQRRHAEQAQLSVRACHLDDRGLDTDGPRRRACRCLRCWYRQWRCPGWFSACTIPVM